MEDVKTSPAGREKAAKPRIGVDFRIGMLAVTEPTPQRRGGYIVWRCVCGCGGEILLDTRCLQRGTVRDCGCVTPVRPGRKDISGQRFGKLVALEPTGAVLRGSAVWRCVCDCGNETVAGQTLLQTGKTKSCGCLQSEIYKENLKLIDGTSVTILEAVKRRPLSDNSSGYTGVYWDGKRGRWIARIGFKGRSYPLGAYLNKQEAVTARRRGEEMHDAFLEWYYAEHPRAAADPKPILTE